MTSPLPNLKQLRNLVKQTESKLKGSRSQDSEEDIIREYEIPQAHTISTLKQEMLALESKLTEHFDDPSEGEDDLNVSDDASENKELEAVSPLGGTMLGLESMGKSSGTELKDSVFMTWSGPDDLKGEELVETPLDTIRRQEKRIHDQQATIDLLKEQLLAKDKALKEMRKPEEFSRKDETQAQIAMYQKELKNQETKYQTLLSLSQEFEEKSRSLLQANKKLQEHLMRLTEAAQSEPE